MKKQFIKVIRKGQKNVRVQLNDGSTLLVSIDQFNNEWELGSARIVFNSNSYISDLTFGLEIEFIGTRDLSDSDFCDKMNRITDGFICDPDRYSNSSPRFWVLGRDGSLRTRRRSYRGYELTSPILHFNEHDIDQLFQVLECVKDELKGHVNSSCGLHVHIGTFKDLSKSQIREVLRDYGLYEVVMDHFVDSRRRGNSNRYCRSNDRALLDNSKYIKLSSYRYSKFNTLECRHHQGTLDFNEMVSWVELVGTLVKQMLNGEKLLTYDTESFLNGLRITDECKKYFTIHCS